MPRQALLALSALLMIAPSLATAQTAEPSQSGEATTQARPLTDLRIDVVKQALQLTPEQMKYWPAIEDAIRSRAEARRERLQRLMTEVRDPQPDMNFIEVLERRADNLNQRAEGLKKLTQAWKPLYETLSDTQKQRMRILAVLVVHRIGERMEMRRMELEDDAEASSAAMGAGAGEGGTGRD